MSAVYPAPIAPPSRLGGLSMCHTDHQDVHNWQMQLQKRWPPVQAYSRVPASVRVMVDKDAKTVTRIVNMEKMRMKRTVPIWINNMVRQKRSMMASLEHMWRTKKMKLSCKNGTFPNDRLSIQAWYCRNQKSFDCKTVVICNLQWVYVSLTL